MQVREAIEVHDTRHREASNTPGLQSRMSSLAPQHMGRAGHTPICHDAYSLVDPGHVGQDPLDQVGGLERLVQRVGQAVLAEAQK